MAQKFSNRLVNESSPYLRQHAYNPVDWYPWGEEALQKAKDLDIPILVSIGYSACHWCHVMEHESFEDDVTARYMNEHFVNIKIDREERPDLDHIYMDAVQAIAGNGGWPLNVFLTPDAKPFYGGTYFPPQKAFNRPSWMEILNFISKLWNEKKDEVLTQANTLTEHIKSSSDQMIGAIIPSLQGEASFTEADCDAIANNALAKADREDGGFGAAPKFPQTFTIQYLLMFGYFFNHQESLDHAIHSLKRMLNGGIYDHLAGGMARYSTDKEWLAPHFEKMLYDNALLVNALCDAYQITKDIEIVNGIDKTLQFLVEEMKHPDGGFYAAIDADSEGVEGKFYVWDKREIEDLLKNDAEWYCRWFGVKENGNWEHKNILNIHQDIEAFANGEGLTINAFNEKVGRCNNILLQHRNKRIRPSTDDKILIGWNALLITAFAKAYAATGNDTYLKEAVQLEVFIDAKFNGNSGAFFHTYKDGKATQPGFLDDYAYIIQSYIHLHEITFETSYLQKALKVSEYVIENFSDTDKNLFYYTHKDQKDAIVRKSEIYDGAVPSGNSIMAENLFYLSVVFDNRNFMERASRMVTALKEVIVKYPTSFAIWATVILKQVVGIAEIVITGGNIIEIGVQIREIYLPAKVLMGSVKPLEYPLLRNKNFENNTWIYLCRQYACNQPVNTIEDLKRQINKEYLNK